jgi:hypothetical protein
MVIQRKLLHTCNYTLYTVYNMQKFLVPIKYGTYLFKNQYQSSNRPTKTLVINYMGNSG